MWPDDATAPQRIHNVIVDVVEGFEGRFMSQISQSDALADDDDGDLSAASGVVYIFNF